MTRLRSLIKEVLSQPKKKDCGCGCNDCGGKAPILTESKVKHLISEGLQHHIDKKISLFESIYRIGSEKHLELIREARALWIRGIIEVSDDDKGLLETHLGHFGLYEGVEVPLDLPMLNEEEKDRFAGSDPKAGSTIKGTGFIAPRQKPKFNKGEVWIWKHTDGDKEIEIRDIRSNGDIIGRITGTSDDFIVREPNKWLKKKISESLSLEERIDSLIKLVKSAKNPRNLPISFGTTSVAIGGTQYDKGELVDMFNGRELGMDSMDIRKVFYNAQQDAEAVADEVNASNSGIEATIGYGYGKRPILYLKKSSLNEDQDKWVVYDTKTKKRLPNAGKIYKDKKAAQAFADKQENAKVASDIYYADNIQESLLEERINTILEAKKKAKSKKKDPPLNKPKRGGSKAYYVYVRDPKTKKIKKVSFGSGGLRAKIKNKEARNAFAARHNCKNKKDRTKAGYWSCNLPRYADQLGLGSKMNTFW